MGQPVTRVLKYTGGGGLLPPQPEQQPLQGLLHVPSVSWAQARRSSMQMANTTYTMAADALLAANTAGVSTAESAVDDSTSSR